MADQLGAPRAGSPPAQAVLCCTTCQHAWEPDPIELDEATTPTGCPWCGGWTWIGELAEPATASRTGRGQR